ncbi:hypothetical protein [Actinomadura sp. 9N407]|uniref:hypothetical protein n=1 Tax=Actinomadura sp. 9N407 TaxID=3375154 RepID=UPI0037B55540
MIEARGTDPSPKDGGPDFWPADDSGHRAKAPRSRLPLIIAAIVVAVVAVAGAVAFFVLGDEEKAASAPGNGARISPVAYTPQMADKDMAKLAQRSADQRPITQGEAFPADVKNVSFQKYSLALAASQVSNDCKTAAWGTRLQAELAKYQCSQIVRGAYVSQDKKYVGQFSAINMANQQGAEQIVRTLDPRTGAGFVLPLTAPGSPAFAKGFSAAYAQAYGHYVIITWVQRAGGVQPGSLNEMIDVSLAVEKPADFVWGRAELADGAQR